MRFTPRILFGSIVGVGLAPAISVGLAVAYSNQTVTPVTTPTASQYVGDAPKVYSTPTYVTPTAKVANKTPHAEGSSSNGTRANRIAVASDDPSSEPTVVSTQTYTAPATAGAGHDEQKQADPTGSPRGPESPAPTAHAPAGLNTGEPVPAAS